MEFPIVDLLDDELSEQWLMGYFHPNGLKCPGCGRGTEAARIFRRTRRSSVTVYRCRHCHRIYNVYSGTLFQGKQLRPAQVILLLRGVCKGEPSTVLAEELGLSRTTVHTLRRAIQRNARQIQPETPLEDQQTETDELFQNAGEKRGETRRPGRSTSAAGKQATGARDIRERSSADGGDGWPGERAGTAAGRSSDHAGDTGRARLPIYLCSGGGLHR